MSAYERLITALELLGSRFEYRRDGDTMAECPAHEDRVASLHVTRGQDRVLINCFGGCDWRDVAAALGLAESDLYDTPNDGPRVPVVRPPRPRPAPAPSEPACLGQYPDHQFDLSHETARYTYTENGVIVGWRLRFVCQRAGCRGKTFRWKKPNPSGGETWGSPQNPPLYRLPAVLAALKTGQMIYVTEGEKDADALTEAGVTACTMGPADNGKGSSWKPWHTQTLQGANVTVCQDRDTPGRRSGAYVAAQLAGVAASVRVVEAVAGKDPADHLAAGYGVADLVSVHEETDTLPTPPADDPEPPADDTNTTATDWATDDGQARYLLDTIGGMLYVIGIGWHLWDGQRWLFVDERRVSSLIKAHYKARFDHYVSKYKTDMDSRWNNGAKTIKLFMGSARLASIVKAMERIQPVEAMQTDAHPHLLNTPAGIVDLRTGDIGPHDPDLLITKVTAGRFIPGYRHPDWEAAKAALPAETLHWLQVRMGAAITGAQIADDAVFMHGGGSNGKSLFSNDGVVRALGDYAMLTSSDLIASRKADATAATPDKADLRGARFVLIEELPEEFAMSTKAVKELAGTGAIRARKLYQQAMTFNATHSLFVNTNHQPNVTDTDWGTWRRLTMVTFPYTFTATPGDETDRQGDRGLVHRVRANTDGQHDAIVTWLVEGAQMALADSSTLIIGKRDTDDGRAAPVRDATREWRKSTDRLMGYTDECLILDPNACVAKVDLLWHFNRWMADQGASKWSARLLADRMKGHPSLPRVTLERPRTFDGLSRPNDPGEFTSQLPTLPARPEVYRGISFREESEHRTVTGVHRQTA